jgi:hypothetical protein
MALDGTTIAAVITGILALLGVLATVSVSGWREQRIQSRANKKTLARYSAHLITAAWELSNCFYAILENDSYGPERNVAYGDGWDRQYTSYLIGQYFAGVYVVREMTHFFAHIRSNKGEMLKKLFWKIQDEFISMDFNGR